MKQINLHNYILLIAGLLSLASCHSVVLKVENVPSNTPLNQDIYVAGNFNNWDPGDEKYRLTRDSDSTYFITLPPGFGTVEFKFTRGDWTSVEKDICGYEIGNRSYRLGTSDTLVQSIASWADLDPEDCPRLTLVLKDIPDNTPEDDQIFVTGDFNGWNPDEESVLRKDSSGVYSVTIPRPQQMDDIEFKITRGEMAKAEADEFGGDLPSRKLKFGQKDTIEIKVKGWIDKPAKYSDRVVFIIEGLPTYASSYGDLYLVSSLNNWTPNDRNYVFQRNNKGQLFLPMPRKGKTLEYKITRGDWSTVEVDRFGFDIPNRSVSLQTADTVFIRIEGWKDMTVPSDKELTVIISSLPANTPENPRIYIAGSFNNWDPSRLRYRFNKNDKGQYYANIPRDQDKFEFRITRGSWNTLEVDKYGCDVLNRKYQYSSADTIFIKIENWNDLPLFDAEEVTIVINKLPGNTPENSNIFLAPDFNSWNPSAMSMGFKFLEDGRRYITVKKRNAVLEFKITRGSWDNVEVDDFGQEIPNRRLYFGFADTVYINVIKWRDFDGTY
jgi:RNase P/RNase MRP subunit p29